MASRYDDLPRERWDRDRFERLSRRNPEEHDYFRFEEREKFGPPGRARQEVIIDERRGSRGHFEERDRYVEEERYGPPARRSTAAFDGQVPPEFDNRALAPYRRPRPQMLRRQSSLDTFDRRPGSNYVDDYRLPAEVPIPLPIRRPLPPAAPARGRYFEEFEERYRDSDEDYRDIRIKEERRGNHRSRSRMRSRSVRRRRHSSGSSGSSSEDDKQSSNVGRKGRTKLPKRLAHKGAIIELGYPYEEEENFIIVQRALDKDHIDVIIEKSKKFREDKVKNVTYKYGGTEERKEEIKEEKKEEIKEIKEIKEEKRDAPVAAGEVVKKTTTTTIMEPPAHHHHHQDLAVVVPSRRHTDEESIRREIAALEAERRLLKLERSDRHRDGEWEVIETDRRPKEVIRVEKDRKGRMALVRSAH